jgi:hypothetical protein
VLHRRSFVWEGYVASAVCVYWTLVLHQAIEKRRLPYRMVFTTAVPGILLPGVLPESTEVGRHLSQKTQSANAFLNALQYP